LRTHTLTFQEGGKMVRVINAFDIIFLQKCNKYLCKKPLTLIFRLISHSGDGYLYALMVLVSLILFDASSLFFVKVLLVGFLFEIPSFILLKNLLKRSRPYKVIKQCIPSIKPSDEFSMPSGHTAAAFMVAVTIAYVYGQYAVYAYTWAALIGISRVFLGVHFPTDIIVGAALGSLCSFLSILFFL
jgi:undecaprenyl-diphosphatase